MKICRRAVIILPLILMSTILPADSYWEGSAAMGFLGRFPSSGAFGVSNSFPMNTILEVRNLENNRKATIVVTGRADGANIFLILSQDAADALGIHQNEVAIVRAVIATGDSASAGVWPDDQPFHPDPDINPAVSSERLPPAELTEEPAADSPGEAVVTREPVPEAVSEETAEPETRAVEIVEQIAAPDVVLSGEDEDLPSVSAVKPVPEFDPAADVSTLTVRDRPAVPPAAGSAAAADEGAISALLPVPEAKLAEEPLVIVPPEPVFIAEIENIERVEAGSGDRGPGPWLTELRSARVPDGHEVVETLVLAADEPIPPPPLPTGPLFPETVPPSITELRADEPDILRVSGLADAVPYGEGPLLVSELPLPVFRETVEATPAAPDILRVSDLEAPATPPESVPSGTDDLPEPVRTAEVMATGEPDREESSIREPDSAVVAKSSAPAVTAAARTETTGRALAGTATEAAGPFSGYIVTEELEASAYYLQLGSFKEAATAERMARGLSEKYPVTVHTSGLNNSLLYKVMLGPLKRDESGTLLYLFRSNGYKDAFVRQGD